jgi:BirA family transcriptional regulator, biotin operon repressor / biotin---[acetyl-CoA-carboxylase] ligase
MDDNLLQLLKERAPAPVSGEEIGRLLGVSRAAIWKKVQALKTLGYEVEAMTRSGYRLLRSPDRLMQAEVVSGLRTRWLGRKVHHFEVLDSTNSTAYRLAMEGAGEGEVVIAEMQQKGKGRLGREWFSPAFLNLYLSVILRPRIPPQQASLITLMAAVAVSEAIEKTSGLHPTIKWPNDVLMGTRKMAGLLNEIHSETDRVHFVILGIGVNVNVDSETMPEEIRMRATSLKEETGRAVSRKAFLQSLFMEMEQWYSAFLKEGGSPILQAWAQRARIEGKAVQVSSFDETLTGTAMGIDPYGALILRTGTGEQKRVVAGDVRYDVKLEARNPKFETNSNGLKKKS